MKYKLFTLSILTLLFLTACSSLRPGKYRATIGYGTYYLDNYSYSSGCTSFKYYIGGSLKGYKQTCSRVKIVANE